MFPLETDGTSGQTPLDPDEAEGLLVPILNRDGLNAVEAANIAEAVRWLAVRRSRNIDSVLSERFLRELHRRMFGQVWVWAGGFRRSDKNLGCPWFEVPIRLRALLDDGEAWVAAGMDADEGAVRFSHRLVSIHPWANGNGRHSRLVGDQLARALGRPVFAWGGAPDSSAAGDVRDRYLDALRRADAGDIGPLVAFARGEG